MKFNRIKFSKEASEALNKMKGRVGLNWNILCRIGFCLSLNDPAPLDNAEYKPDVNGIEIERKILIGNEEEFYVALLKEWCLLKDIMDEKNQTEYFKAHMNRGILLLSKRISSFKDLSQLLTTVV